MEALEEAITVIREVWAADRPGPVRVDGKYYRVHGAKRGPSRRTTSGSGSVRTSHGCCG
ncbi:hypothetical protein ACFQ1L_20575 [Phytohabitans flavus]|uniref:hypothetical protein n=1 Tax=Phytohabitans flavus TaxID=1076124 RepID=UPI00363AFBC3